MQGMVGASKQALFCHQNIMTFILSTYVSESGFTRDSLLAKQWHRLPQYMKDTLSEACAALAKSKDEMARYYNRRRTPAPKFNIGDKVFLDASDIRTTRPSKKLSHHYLGPFKVICPIGSHAYHLHLPHSMS